MGRRRDHPQRRRQRGIVLRREQGRHQHQIGNPVADRVERAFGGVREQQLRAYLVPHDGGEVRGLAPVRFDGKNDGHCLSPQHEEHEHAGPQGEDQ